MDARTLELLERVTEHAAAAATDPNQWVPLVRDFNELFSARNAVLFTPQPAADVQSFGVAHGDIAYGVDDYFANWAHEDAWLKAVAGTGFFEQAGEARFSQEFLPDAALRKTAFFNDFALHYNAEQSLALKVIDRHDTNAPVMHFTLFRRLTDQPFTKQDRTLLRVLWPHLQRAAQSHWALQPVRQAGRAVEATLDVLPTPIWVVREDAHVEFANAKARELMRTRSWAHQHSGRLQAIGHLDMDALRNHIRQGAMRAHRGGRLFAISVTSNKQLLRGMLRVIPIAETALYVATWPRARALLMLEVAPSRHDNGLWLTHLAERFNLTHTQCLVLESLGQGLSVQGIAMVRGIKEGTVRAHLHQLLSKTGLTNQSDLVRLALGR